MQKIFAAFVGLCLVASGAAASPMTGEKTVYLTEGAGGGVPIADIVFEPHPDGAAYTITMREAPFTDHFLSMRPFKCLEGSAKHWCHVPYPYEIRRVVSSGDLTDLEYDLLFLWKESTEYGINMWNGVYYRLDISDDRIIGALHEMDMDILSAPPEPGNTRPVGAYDVEESDPDSHWLPYVVIK